MTASMGSNAGADVDASLGTINVDKMASMGSNACANVDGSCGILIANLARALQYFDEMPDSADSGGNADE